MSRYPKSKSSPPYTPSDSEQQQEQWRRHFDTLSLDKQQLVAAETTAAKEACGSRLAVAMHLSQVHDVLCQDLKTSKQKRQWTLYLQATLPGLASSRSQVFKDIQAWRVAQVEFRPEFLDEFFANGYALTVRPSAEQPLGKMTEPCKHVLSQVDYEPSAAECRTLLAEAAKIVKEAAKANRTPRTPESAEEKRERIFKEVHESILNSLEGLSQSIEPGDKYPTRNVRDELEEIVGRLLTATGVETLELEQRRLPEGYRSLNLPAPAPKPSKNATRSGGSRTQVARAAKRKSLRTPKTVADKGTTPVSTIEAEEEVPSLV